METANFIELHDSADEKENCDDIENGCVEFDSRRTGSEEREEDRLGSEEASQKSDVQQIDLGGPPEAVPEKGFVGGYDSDMEIEDLNEVPASEGSGHAFVSNGVNDLDHEPGQVDYRSAENLSASVVNTEFTMTVPVGDEDSVGITKKKGNSVSGVKRPRMMFEEDNPSVCVKYNSLTRSSKLKLEELLQKWSEWHAQHGSSAQDSSEPLESGEDTFFPALHIGVEKATSVSFWMDQKTRKQEDDEFVPLDHKSVPLYDRGYALGLTSDDGTSNAERGLEIIDDAARCFNCGSYNHALKDCPKPRDSNAVNNARKQHKSKRNQNSGSRNQARYYQNSPSGKYDGLRPGALDAETRKLLGLGELDPPPWLNRMREIGYPPGYLDPDEEDQPSGITIFADNEFKEDQEEGEIVDADITNLEKKMSVEFPGINVPIPKNADGRLWASASPQILDISRSRLLHRSSASEPITNVRGHHHEERRSRSELREDDDDRPPGVDRGFDPSVSTYLPRYGSSSSSYESIYNSPSPRLESLGRFESERGRRSRFHDEGSPFGSSSQHSTRLSPADYGSLRHGNRVDESRDGYDFDYSPHGNRDRHDRYRHQSRW